MSLGDWIQFRDAFLKCRGDSAAAEGLLSAWFPGKMEPPVDDRGRWVSLQKPVDKNYLIPDPAVNEVIESLNQFLQYRPIWIVRYVSDQGQAFCQQCVIMRLLSHERDGIYLEMLPLHSKSGEEDERLKLILWCFDTNLDLVSFGWMDLSSQKQHLYLLEKFESAEDELEINLKFIPRMGLWSLSKAKGGEEKRVQAVPHHDGGSSHDELLVVNPQSIVEGVLRFIDVLNEERADDPPRQPQEEHTVLWLTDPPPQAEPGDKRLPPGDVALLLQLYQYVVHKQKSKKDVPPRTDGLDDEKLKGLWDRITNGYVGECLDKGGNAYKEIDMFCEERKRETGKSENALRGECARVLMRLYHDEVHDLNRAYQCRGGAQVTQVNHEVLLANGILSREDFTQIMMPDSRLALADEVIDLSQFGQIMDGGDGKGKEQMKKRRARRIKLIDVLEAIWKKMYTLSRSAIMVEEGDISQDESGDGWVDPLSMSAIVTRMLTLHRKYKLFGDWTVRRIQLTVQCIYDKWKAFITEKNGGVYLDTEDQNFIYLLGQQQNKLIWDKSGNKSLQAWDKYLCMYAGTWGKKWRCDYTFISIRVFLALDEAAGDLSTKIQWLDDGYARVEENERRRLARPPQSKNVARDERIKELFQALDGELQELIPKKAEQEAGTAAAAVTWKPYRRLLLELPLGTPLYQVILATCVPRSRSGEAEDSLQNGAKQSDLVFKSDFDKTTSILQNLFLTMKERQLTSMAVDE